MIAANGPVELVSRWAGKRLWDNGYVVRVARKSCQRKGEQKGSRPRVYVCRSRVACHELEEWIVDDLGIVVSTRQNG